MTTIAALFGFTAGVLCCLAQTALLDYADRKHKNKDRK